INIKTTINISSLEVIANLSLALIAINAAFFTFFITLKESPIFIRLRERFSDLYIELNIKLKHNIIVAILLSFSIFLVILYKHSDYLCLNFISSIIVIYLILENIIGFLYLLDITTNLIIAEKKTEERRK